MSKIIYTCECCGKVLEADEPTAQLLSQFKQRAEAAEAMLKHKEVVGSAELVGISDYLDGKALSDNPYSDDDCRQVWEIGYLRQQRTAELEQRAEAAERLAAMQAEELGRLKAAMGKTVADERERCAKLCEQYADLHGAGLIFQSLATDIRYPRN